MQCDGVTWYFQDTVVYGALFIVDPKIILLFIIDGAQAIDIQINPHEIDFLEQMYAPNIRINAVRISHIGALNIGLLMHFTCVVVFDTIRYVVDGAFGEQVKFISVIYKRFQAQMFKIR